MNFLAKLLLGNGTLKPKLKQELEAEGLVLIEEGLSGSVRYKHFKAPGRRFNGKVTGERVGLALSEERVVVYCRSGRTKLIDTAFTNPRLAMVDVLLEDDDKVAFRIDYDRGDEPKISGEIRIVAETPKASVVVGHLQHRLGR